MRTSDFILVLGTVAAVILALLAFASMRVSCEDTYRGCETWGMTPATAIFAGSAVTVALSSAWYAFMARGLASAIRLLAGAKEVDTAT